MNLGSMKSRVGGIHDSETLRPWCKRMRDRIVLYWDAHAPGVSSIFYTYFAVLFCTKAFWLPLFEHNGASRRISLFTLPRSIRQPSTRYVRLIFDTRRFFFRLDGSVNTALPQRLFPLYSWLRILSVFLLNLITFWWSLHLCQ